MANIKKIFTIPSSGGTTSFTYDLSSLGDYANISWSANSDSITSVLTHGTPVGSVEVSMGEWDPSRTNYGVVFPTSANSAICDSCIVIQQTKPQNEEPSTSGSCDCDDFKIGKIYVSEECGCDNFYIRAIYVDESCTCDKFYIKNIYVDESCNCSNFYIKSIYVDESCNCSGFYIKSITVE